MSVKKLKQIKKKKVVTRKKKTSLVLVKTTKPKKTNTLRDSEYLLELLGGDKDLMLFFMTWVANGRNATKAYLKLHPNVSEASAAVLGSMKLRNIKIDVILEGFGLGVDTYMEQLKNGLEAVKYEEVVSIDNEGNIEKQAIPVPDHKVRRNYHAALGKMLNFEKDSGTNVLQLNQNTNQNNNSIDNVKDDELDQLLSRG